ncbi:MAG: excinuclease ABC subunit UvrC [bacterium]|nr:excinuclease ABC subunit UvrC [bacterium]
MVKIELEKVPVEPGVYIFKKQNVIIYIGKAKQLKNRLRSYVNPKDSKTIEIVTNADSLEYIITESDLEAQILESKLIFQYKPLYNIQYKYRNPLKYISVIDKDGYPFFSIDSEWNVNTLEMFGPFIHGINFKELIRILSLLFGIRLCNYDFNRKRPKLCMYYYIGLCSGPCEHKISKKEYNENFKKALDFVKLSESSIKELINEYNQKIKYFSEKQEFEKAIIYRDKMYTLQNYLNKIITNTRECYIYLATDNDFGVLGIFLPPTNLKILEIQNFQDLTPAQIIFNTLPNIFAQKIFIQPEYYQQVKDFIENYTKIYQDEISQKIKQIQIECQENDEYKYLMNMCTNKLNHLKKEDVYIVLKGLSEFINVETIFRIESVDISHLSGENVYGSLVVFEKSNFIKSKYRIFKLHGSSDDLSNIYELVFRRFCNLSKDKDLEIHPQLMIIDGGTNQLLSAIKAYKDSKISSNVKFISIAKPNDKIYFYENENIINLQLPSNIWNFIRKLRDEAHRFANSKRKTFSKIL